MSEESDELYPENLPEDPIEETTEEFDESADDEETDNNTSPAPRRPYTSADDVVRHHLRGMYQTWFLEYASYVIL